MWLSFIVVAATFRGSLELFSRFMWSSEQMSMGEIQDGKESFFFTTLTVQVNIRHHLCRKWTFMCFMTTPPEPCLSVGNMEECFTMISFYIYLCFVDQHGWIQDNCLRFRPLLHFSAYLVARVCGKICNMIASQ